MPTVPRVTGPEVTPQAPPNAMLSTAGGDPAAFGGVQARQFAEAAVIAQRVSDRNDLDQVFRAETALKTGYLAYEREELGKQGANVDGVAERTKKWWDDAESRYAEGLTNQQRAVYQQRAAQVRLAGTETLMRHEQTQKNKSLVESTTATAQTSIDLAVADPSPPRLAKARTDVATAVGAAGRVLGWTDDQKKQATLKFTTQMHTQIIEGLAMTDADAARAHYYAAKRDKEIDPANYAKLQKQLDVAGIAQTAQTDAAKLVAKYSPEQITEVQKEIDASGGSAEQKAATRQEVEHRFTAIHNMQTRLHANATGKVMAAYSNGATLAQLQKMPEWANLRDGGAAIKEHVLDRQHALAVRSEEDRARAMRNLAIKNFAAYERYADPVTINALSRGELEALLPVLGPDLTGNLLTKKDAFTKSAEKVLEASIDAQDFNAAAEKMGLRPFDKTKNETQLAELNTMRVNAESAINRWQVEHGKTMPREEKRALVERLIATTVAQRRTLAFLPDRESSVLGLDLNKNWEDVVVPAADVQQIRARFNQVRGTDPTPREVVEAYVAKKVLDAAGK